MAESGSEKVRNRQASLIQTPYAYLGLLAFLVIFPALVALIILLLGDTWFPGGDMAQAELHMRGFFSRPPLVGAAGRIVSDSGIQGSHPGPSLWFAMLPVYLIGGATSSGLLAAVVSVHLVAVGLLIWLAYRRGGMILAWTLALALLAFIRSSGPDFLIEPWNPWLALLPFGVFIFLIAEVIEPTSFRWRERRDLILGAAVLVGSHCIQCHAGYALVVGAGLLGAFILAGRDFDQPRRLGHVVRLLRTSGLAGLIIWIPPIIDQIRRDPGNLEILWQHFGSPSEPTISLTTAIREIATQVNILGPWFTGPGVESPSYGWARYGGCLFLVVVAVWSWRQARRNHWRDLQVLIAVSGFLTVIGALSITRIFGPFYEYTFRWMWVLVAVIMAGCLTVGVRTIATRFTWSSSTRVAKVAVACTVSVVAFTSLQIADRVKLPGATDSEISANLHREMVAKIDPDLRYLIRFYDPYTLNATGFGMALALERSGFNVGVDPAFAAAALPHRTRTEDEVDLIFWVVVGPAVEEAQKDPSLSQVAYYNPRSAQEQQVAERLLVDIAEGLRNSGRGELVSSLQVPGASLLFSEPPLAPEVAVMVRQLIAMGQPVAIFSIPPGVVPTSLQ